MRFSFLLSLAFLASSFVAQGDTFSTFNLTATLDPTRAGVGANITGQVVLDETTGYFTDGNFTVLAVTYFGPSLSSYSVSGAPTFQTSFSNGLGTTLTGFCANAAEPCFQLDLPLESLIGYTGGQLCSLNSPCNAGSGNYSMREVSYTTPGPGFAQGYGFNVETGSLSASPEPSTFLLMGVGLLSLLGTAIRRRCA